MVSVVTLKEMIKSRRAPLGELGQGARKDPYLLYNFLMDNNLQDVNKTLREDLGNKDLPFVADRKKIEFIIDGYIRAGNNKALQKILDEFDFNPDANNYTTRPEFLNSFNPGNTKYAGRFDAASIAQAGQGVGAFLGPVFSSLGSDTTTQTTTDSKTSSLTVIVIFGVIAVVVGTVYFLFFNKPQPA